MNLICIICSELLIASDDIFNTLCGHVFHHVCLLQWLERSKTCPQCREKTNSSSIRRLYLNFPNNDAITDDVCSLQHKVDKLTFDLTMRDKDIKQYVEKTTTLEKQNRKLKDEVKKIEGKIREKETAIAALKEQVKYFQQLTSEIEPTKQEVARLKKKLEELRNVQRLLDAPPENVEDVVTRDCDAETLFTYVTLLKRELDASFQKRKELRAMFKSVQRELAKVSLDYQSLEEEHVKRKKLEEELIICEQEKVVLQNKLQSMKSNDSKEHRRDKAADTGRNNENKTVCTNMDKEKKMIDKGTNTDVNMQNTLREKDTLDLFQTTKQHTTDVSTRSQGIFGLKERYHIERAGENSTMSVLAKKPKLSHTLSGGTGDGRMTYNGLGGHSKYDQFPNPLGSSRVKKVREDLSKHRKNKLDVGDNKKLSDLVKNILTS